MRKMKFVVFLCCILCTIVSVPFISSCAQAPTTSAPTTEVKSLTIGLINALTGPMAPGQVEMANGANLAAEWLNEKGGIKVNGQQYLIKINSEDDMSTPQGATAAANKLIQNGVKFVLAPMDPTCNIAIASICEDAKAIRMKLNGIGGPSEISSEQPYCFAANMNIYNVPHIYDYLHENYPQVKKIAIVVVDDPISSTTIATSTKEAQARGMEVISAEKYQMGTEDFYPILTKTLALKPDAIDMCLGMVPWQAGIIKQARELGFNGPMYSEAPGGDINLLLNIVGTEFGHDAFFAEADVTSPKMPDLVKEVGKRVKERTKDTFMSAQPDAWSALWVVVQGIQAAQSLDTEVIAKTLRSMKNIEQVWGNGPMGGQEIFGINNVARRPMPLSRVVNGKLEFIKFFAP